MSEGKFGYSVDDDDVVFLAYRHEDMMRVGMDVTSFSGPKHAGIFMADAVKHFAKAMHQAGYSPTGKPEDILSERDLIKQVRRAFLQEMRKPTSPLTGQIQREGKLQ
ncbi:MAG: hypothetical protein NXH88_10035 [Hyphomonas sp.]|nr:hypothetical protein [Hyphomonas sp.]